MGFLSLLPLFLFATTAFATSSCPEKTCHASNGEGTEHNLNVPWQLNQISDFALEPTLLDLFNKQINLELQAFYTYESMSVFFDRDDVAMHGFHKLFKDSADEELGHAREMMSFVNQRGGSVTFGSLVTPCLNDLLSTERDTVAEPRRCRTVETKYATVDSTRATVQGHVGCDWRDATTAVAAARQVELNVWRHLKLVHRHAEKLSDVNSQDFIETYIKEGQESTKELADLLTRLRRVEPCVGHHLIDQELLNKK